MHSKSNNIEVITYDDANLVIEEIFQLFLSIYQIRLETLIKESTFVFFSFRFNCCITNSPR